MFTPNPSLASYLERFIAERDTVLLSSGSPPGGADEAAATAGLARSAQSPWVPLFKWLHETLPAYSVAIVLPSPAAVSAAIERLATADASAADATASLAAAASLTSTPLAALASPTGYACALILFFCAVWFAAAGAIIGCRRRLTRAHRLPAAAWIEWDSYLVSTAHTLVSLAAAAPYAMLAPIWGSFLATDGPARDHGLISLAFGTDPGRDVVLAITAGYLLYDLIVILRHQKEFFFKSPAPAPAAPASGGLLRRLYARVAAHPGLPVLIHHTVVISTFAGGLTSRMATYYMAALIPNEASTVFVNANYFMAASSNSRALTETLAYKLNGVLLLVVFFLCRVYHNTLLSAHALTGAWPVLGATTAAAAGHASVLAAVLLTAGLLVHVAVNLWWFRGILTAVLRKLSRASASAAPATAAAPSVAAPAAPAPAAAARGAVSAAPACALGSVAAAGAAAVAIGAASPQNGLGKSAVPPAAAGAAGAACALGEISAGGDTADAQASACALEAVSAAAAAAAAARAAEEPSECAGIEGVRAPTPTDADGLRCRR